MNATYQLHVPIKYICKDPHHYFTWKMNDCFICSVSREFKIYADSSKTTVKWYDDGQDRVFTVTVPGEYKVQARRLVSVVKEYVRIRDMSEMEGATGEGTEEAS